MAWFRVARFLTPFQASKSTQIDLLKTSDSQSRKLSPFLLKTHTVTSHYLDPVLESLHDMTLGASMYSVACLRGHIRLLHTSLLRLASSMCVCRFLSCIVCVGIHRSLRFFHYHHRFTVRSLYNKTSVVSASMTVFTGGAEFSFDRRYLRRFCCSSGMHNPHTAPSGLRSV